MTIDKVQLEWMGGPWDGANFVQSREIMRCFLGRSVLCKPMRSEMAEADGPPLIEEWGESWPAALYTFDEGFSHDGDRLYLKFDKLVTLKSKPQGP